MTPAINDPRDDDGQVEIGRLFLLPMVPFLILACSAPVKILTNWRAFPSLIGSLVAMAVMLLALRRIELPMSRRPRYAALAVLLSAAALVAGLLVWLLYNRHVYGMVNVHYQPDAGTHVYLSRVFMERNDPPQYEGCLSFHAVVWWLGRLFGLTALTQFIGAFYFVVIALPLVCATLAAATIARPTRTVLVASGVAFALAVGFVAYRVWFPLLHGFQALASYGQIFYMVGLFVGWGAYAVCRAPSARLISGAFAIGLMRYTYGLNLPDVLVAYALLCLFEAIELPGIPRRLVAAALAAALAYGAYVGYQKIWPMHELDGPRPQQDLIPHEAMLGQLIAATVLALVPAIMRLRAPAARTVRFAAFFGLATGIAQYLYLSHKQPQLYYFFKYQFCGPLVTSAGLALATVCAVAALVDGNGGRVRPALGLLLVVVGAQQAVARFDRGFSWYRTSARERIDGTPRYATFDALCDLDESRLIERVLAKRHKKLGGFYSARWAYTEFMNQQLHGEPISWEVYFNDPGFVPGGISLSQPGVCFFWDRPSTAFAAQGLPHVKVISLLEARPDRACYKFKARTEPPGVDGLLCAACN